MSTRQNTKPCCAGASNVTDKLSSSNWNYFEKSNSKLIEIKQELLAGKAPKYCSNCKSERHWYKEFTNSPLIISEINDFNLQSIDARWNNTCQLSCTYCGSGDSSKWAQLLSMQSAELDSESHRMTQENLNKIYQLVSNNNIKRVSMLGGEPLLIKENIRLLELLDKSVRIEIFTNLNVVLEGNKLFEQLVQRPNVQWYVSMETIGKKFEFVRRGANWDRQIYNLEKLTTETHGKITLQSQYCAYNALHLRELYEFTDRYTGLSINWGSAIQEPQCLNFLNFPKVFKQQSLEQIDQCLEQWSENTQSLTVIRQQVVDNMDSITPGLVEKCIEWHRQQESQFFDNQFDFVELWPEYAVNQTTCI